MNQEQFKEELFAKLAEARSVNPNADFFSVPKTLFSSPVTIADMRAYMNSEMQKLTMAHPYCFQYVICKSTADELVFFDITPVIKEYTNGVDIIYRFYDCDTDSVTKLLEQKIKL